MKELEVIPHYELISLSLKGLIVILLIVKIIQDWR